MASTNQENQAWVPSSERSAYRNLFIYDSDNRDTVLGGLFISPGMTNINLYSWVEIICIFRAPFTIQYDNQQPVPADENALTPGNYYIVTSGSITPNGEVPLRRLMSLGYTGRVPAFRPAVRDRDRGCVVTLAQGIIGGVGFWELFEAAHIFPLALSPLWNNSRLGRWITVPPARESDGSINSVQNGIFLSRDMHVLFDTYQFSINPDVQDGYKIICFTPLAAQCGIAGRQPAANFLSHPHRPPKELLRWHFRQAVLTHMKGGGECCFETDIEPGSGLMGQLTSGPEPTGGIGYGPFGHQNLEETCA